MEYKTKNDFNLPNWGNKKIKSKTIFMDFRTVIKKQIEFKFGGMAGGNLKDDGDKCVFIFDENFVPIDYLHTSLFVTSHAQNIEYWSVKQFFADLKKHDKRQIAQKQK
jgi:hypothetical protein